jgi:rubrerythrin
MTLRERVAELLWDRCAITTGQSLEFADSILALINEERCEWLNPTWVCNVCGHVEYEEREVLCWDCGEGEMIYQPRCSKKD